MFWFLNPFSCFFISESEADLCDVRIGDEIVSIDGVDVNGYDLDSVVRRLATPSVRLQLKRQSSLQGELAIASLCSAKEGVLNARQSFLEPMKSNSFLPLLVPADLRKPKAIDGLIDESHSSRFHKWCHIPVQTFSVKFCFELWRFSDSSTENFPWNNCCSFVSGGMGGYVSARHVFYDVTASPLSCV